MKLRKRTWRVRSLSCHRVLADLCLSVGPRCAVHMAFGEGEEAWREAAKTVRIQKHKKWKSSSSSSSSSSVKKGGCLVRVCVSVGMRSKGSALLGLAWLVKGNLGMLVVVGVGGL